MQIPNSHYLKIPGTADEVAAHTIVNSNYVAIHFTRLHLLNSYC